MPHFFQNSKPHYFLLGKRNLIHSQGGASEHQKEEIMCTARALSMSQEGQVIMWRVIGRWNSTLEAIMMINIKLKFYSSFSQ